MKEDFIKYIISFLLGNENEKFIDEVSYGEHPTAHVIINKSAFFNNLYNEGSKPQKELKKIDGIPVLFGSNKVNIIEEKIYFDADLIASTFYLISRYEEVINPKRDKHGRLTLKDSFIENDILQIPIVDEYGALLRRYMRYIGLNPVEPKDIFNKIYLTHDVDEVWRWNNIHKAVRTCGKRIITNQGHYFESLLGLFNYKKYDTIYTFPWLVEMDNYLKKKLGKEMVEDVYFVKGGGESACDDLYYKNEKRYRDLLEYLKSQGSTIGVHTSYSAGKDPQLIDSETKYLKCISGYSITYNRNHYLDSREPYHMEGLIAAGITDDFTMGYADCVGFRLGTCRAVKWINPQTLKVTDLTLHPLTIMEHSLDTPFYMNLDEESAFEICVDLIGKTKKHHGDLTLLWHNSTVSVNENGYQRKLYDKIINYIVSLYTNGGGI